MNSSIFIAQLLGIVYLSVFIGFLLNKKYYENMMADMIKSPPTLYLGGILALVVGYAILYFHHTWEANWTSLVTLIGWISLIKGVVILISPSHMQAFAEKMMKWTQFKLIMVLVLGAVFAYFGFFA